MEAKTEEPSAKVDGYAAAFRMFSKGETWRAVRRGLVGLGLRDHEAKKIAKSVNETIHGKRVRRKSRK